MCFSHRMHKEHWLLLFLASLLNVTKTTVLKIGSSDYQFLESLIRLPLQKEFLDEPSILGVPRLSVFGEQALAEFSL